MEIERRRDQEATENCISELDNGLDCGGKVRRMLRNNKRFQLLGFA